MDYLDRFSFAVTTPSSDRDQPFYLSPAIFATPDMNLACPIGIYHK
jgi:hypothetical protein